MKIVNYTLGFFLTEEEIVIHNIPIVGVVPISFHQVDQKISGRVINKKYRNLYNKSFSRSSKANFV